jgi:hypothetical protein
MAAMGLTGSTLDQLDQIGDWGLLATNADLLVTRWNRWLEQRSGMLAADVVGRPLFEVFPDLVTRRLDRYYRQALTGQTVFLSQRLHKYVIPLPQSGDSPAGAFHQQTSRIVPLMEDGAVCGTLTLVEDVTERVAYEAELRARLRSKRPLQQWPDPRWAALRWPNSRRTWSDTFARRWMCSSSKFSNDRRRGRFSELPASAGMSRCPGPMPTIGRTGLWPWAPRIPSPSCPGTCLLRTPAFVVTGSQKA